MSIISKLKEILDSSTYARENPDEVIQTFQRLSVKVSRIEHSFPVHYLVLTEMVANEVIVLNTLDDKVYRVDFEGGDEKLLNGVLQAEWQSFEEFLIAYFDL